MPRTSGRGGCILSRPCFGLVAQPFATCQRNFHLGEKKNHKNYASYYRTADFTAVKCQREREREIKCLREERREPSQTFFRSGNNLCCSHRHLHLSDCQGIAYKDPYQHHIFLFFFFFFPPAYCRIPASASVVNWLHSVSFFLKKNSLFLSEGVIVKLFHSCAWEGGFITTKK